MNLVYLNGPYRGAAYSRSSRSPAVTKSGTVYYPLWLAYAAGWAGQQTDCQVTLLDAVARRLDLPLLLEVLGAIKPDIVYCDTSTPSITEDLATAAAVKRRFPDCRLVLVGPHASALPEAVLRAEPAVDAVCRGEFDATAVALAEAQQVGRDWAEVPGVSVRRGDEVIHAPERPLLADLDALPFVSAVYAKHLHVEDYFFAAAQYPMVMTVTSRGCPHRCQWCLYPQVMHRGKYRRRSAADVAAEFAWITDNLPAVREVGIEDDLFTGDRRRLHEICDLLIAQNNRLGFWCDTRVDLDYESMVRLRQAGCRLLIAGFESGSQAVLDRIGKGTRVETAYDFMAHAKRAGLLVHGCFVLGNPGETTATMAETLAFAKRLDPDTAQFFPMIVYPGTAMYDQARQQGWLRTEDFGQWLTPAGLHDSVVDLPGLSGVEVRRFCDDARREFYLRRRYILKKVGQSVSDVHEARRNLKAFMRFARHLVRAS